MSQANWSGVLMLLVIAGCASRDRMAKEVVVAGLVFDDEIRIRAPISTVWKAITDPEIVSQYYLCPLVKLDLKQGGEVIYGSLEQPLIAGKVLKVETDRTLVHSFVFDPASHPGVEEGHTSRVAYTLRTEGSETVLRLVHDGFGEDRQTYANVTGGWPVILEKLKAIVEDGSD